MTDPIADMIIRIKNSVMAGRKDLVMPHSKLKEALARILKDFDYIDAYEVLNTSDFKEIKITLKYAGKASVISGVKRVSKPGCRIYKSADAIPNTLNGYGLTILSTNKGIMDGKSARKNNIGGEVLCQIW
ncbi:MAG: 30S ribosomal protein S8 [Candidatus Pacebacteria bacterium GW2011_GWF2_38_9]|nr:MAG: 30S ribosomal protein S8, small subunit ribosomal protein S8 [candidate division TM6 bacterium GW2011_GWF2_28_16]KKQ08253.1 MAG: 30S ribosomal protein S8 [Candidatus Pacebacteria bacterium GW2011_GWF1_36_5]KKQ88571.1 MAG: 30S ribosomal protein S8 [Candidatus Pacebacteria bacterium GW2011_GWF2_38_9]MBU1033544.1 30S ribosomal protein S8 [Patescibacteria group bacterium]HAZ73522.1 30S ribosomal protein S8 [Candidatus Paceibacterota bacterium]